MTYWDTVCVLLTDALSLSLALLERVFVLELGAHVDGMYEDVDVDVGSCLLWIGIVEAGGRWMKLVVKL